MCTFRLQFRDHSLVEMGRMTEREIGSNHTARLKPAKARGGRGGRNRKRQRVGRVRRRSDQWVGILERKEGRLAL